MQIWGKRDLLEKFPEKSEKIFLKPKSMFWITHMSFK